MEANRNSRALRFKRALAGMLGLLCLLYLLCGCGETPPDSKPSAKNSEQAVPSEDVSSAAAVPDEDVSSENQKITVSFESMDGKTSLTEEGIGSVTLSPGVRYQVRDKITVSLAEGQHYLAVSLCEKAGEAILYLPQGEFIYQIPSTGKNFLPPAMFNAENTISARIPTESELASERNLARNPYDGITSGASAFPHAFSNNQYNTAEFGAHNVLDGCTSNRSHGNYPYQSWGAGETVRESDWLTIQLGRTVEVDTLTLYLRADFSSNHDAYFSSVTVEFSDGSKKVITPERSAEGQSFSLGGVKTDSVKLTGFTLDKSRGTWAGYTEVEVYGREIRES